MEVHAHSHSPRKKWTHFVWEFIMLFLAVFCGYLAEYQLEKNIEKHREKEFILSMIEDAENDTAAIHQVIMQNSVRMIQADSLARVSANYKGSQGETSRIYLFARRTVYYPELFYPTDRTLFQLKNAGGMRLIRSKRSSEVIIAYDNSGKNVVNQQAYYEHYLTALTEASNHLMSFASLLNYNEPGSASLYNNAKLLNPTPEKLQELSNMAVMFEGVMMQYVIRLKEMEKQALELINTLKEEYHLK